MPKRILIYTDASFCDKINIAACGYVILRSKKRKILCHNVYLIEGLNKPSDAEMYSAILALNFVIEKGLEEGDKIFIKADCFSVIYKSKKVKSGTVEDQLNKLLNGLSINGITTLFSHVRGHSGETYNTMVDVSCRTHLRKHRKQVMGTSQIPALK